MPLRAKTPPPPQDEVFMTIHYPYPQHANMEMEEDIERVARWLGSIVKPAYFNAFYHKPSARNKVIIEVSKAIGDDKRKLLGQHTWKEILKNPSEGEKGQRSRIFYCVFNNIRDVQKEGWKRKDFKDTWFMPRDGRKFTSIHYDQAEWERIVEKDGVFNIPYPESTRCEVPMEDPTNRGFCRPLPVDLFPIPVLPEMPREVPGTLEWAKVKAIPESEWAKMPPKAVRQKSGSQKTAQPKGNTQPKAPRNKYVGPPVAPVTSGVKLKTPGSLPPGLVINDKGKGKQKETDETDEPSPSADEILAHTIAMGLDGEDEEYQEYYGAGLGDPFASAGVATSPTLPLAPDYDPIDHTGVGVHVSGVTVKPVVVEDSLWGDPLENLNKEERKEDEVPLCDFHGKICSKGVCSVYGKQLREYRKQQELKKPKVSRSWRDENGGQSNGRGGPRGHLLRRGLLLRGPEREPEPRPSTDENRAPRRPNGVTPPRNARPRPNDDPKVNNAWGTGGNSWSPSERGRSTKPNDDQKTDNAWGTGGNSWSPSEMGRSAKPVDKSDSNSNAAEDDNGEEDRPWNPPAAQDWSQSEIGSRAGPRSRPGNAGGKPKVTKNGPGRARKPTAAESAWGGVDGAKDWTPSELGAEDSVSQRGDDLFRNAPNRNPEKKSWADEVEDEYTNGDHPPPAVVPEPELGGGDEDDDGWVQSAKGKGKGKGKAKSTTGWSDLTNQGHW